MDSDDTIFFQDMDIQSQTVVHAFRGRHIEPRTSLHPRKVDESWYFAFICFSLALLINIEPLCKILHQSEKKHYKLFDVKFKLLIQ